MSYYDRKGREIDVKTWGAFWENIKYRLVKSKRIKPYSVWTIWLGHQLNLGEEPKHIFETMIMNHGVSALENQSLPYQQTYATEEEALIGHEKAVEYILKLTEQNEQPTN